MKKVPINLTVVVALLGLSTLWTSAQAGETQIHSKKAIDAEVIDAGDYYLGLDGNPIRFKRKKNIFLKLDSIRKARQQKHQRAKSDDLGNSIPTSRALTPGFSRINQHRWGALEIIRTDQTQSNFSTRNQADQQTINPVGLAPVFTSENGRGEYLILPDIMISFRSKRAVTQHQQNMLRQFGMRIKNQMMFSDTNYVLTFDEPITDYAQVFRTTREIMALPYIEWAEPNMQVKLKKSAVPNDYLFREQWGLYNWGMNGAFCDANTDVAADIDANDAWDLMDTLTLGPKPVIAVIDDGVHLAHPDLPIWTNPSPSSGIYADIPNRCEDDINGCNFGDFYEKIELFQGNLTTKRIYNKNCLSQPSPIAFGSSCTTDLTIPPSPKTSTDTHGTQAAGIAAAKRNNTIGITGSAYDAEILPIRLDGFGDFGSAIDCITLADALSYAAKYADVISNSWRLDEGDKNQFVDPPTNSITCQSSLDTKINQIANGDIAFKRSTLGTPILFASGNSGAGWQKISIQVPSANSTIKFALHKDDLLFTESGEDAVWIDNVQLPGSVIETFSATMPSTNWNISNNAVNTTTPDDLDYVECTSTPDLSALPVAAMGNHTIGGTGYALKLTTTQSNCKYLEVTNVAAGALTFWVWVSAETWFNSVFREGELFRVYVNGVKTGNDYINRNTQHRGINIESSIYHDVLAYPASHVEVIAVGASNDGSDAQMEDRTYFSQYGPTLDVVAPGTAIRTTTSSGGYGYLSGTSASTPMVAGIVANMLAVDPGMTLTDIKTHLKDGADQIGPNAGEFAYAPDFNKYYGHGRANSYKSVRLVADAAGMSYDTLLFPAERPETCEDPNPGAADDGFWLLMLPAILSGAKNN